MLASTRHHGALHCGAIPGVAQGQSGLRRNRSLLQPARLPNWESIMGNPPAAGDSPRPPAGLSSAEHARHTWNHLRPPGTIALPA